MATRAPLSPLHLRLKAHWEKEQDQEEEEEEEEMAVGEEKAHQ